MLDYNLLKTLAPHLTHDQIISIDFHARAVYRHKVHTLGRKLKQDQYIDAIKDLRQDADLYLKDAKDTIDLFPRRPPTPSSGPYLVYFDGEFSDETSHKLHAMDRAQAQLNNGSRHVRVFQLVAKADAIPAPLVEV